MRGDFQTKPQCGAANELERLRAWGVSRFRNVHCELQKSELKLWDSLRVKRDAHFPLSKASAGIMKVLLAFALCLQSLLLSVHAAEFFVSPRGRDEADGKAAQNALATVGKGVSMLKAG